jgi:hypothetical protein
LGKTLRKRLQRQIVALVTKNSRFYYDNRPKSLNFVKLHHQTPK